MVALAMPRAKPTPPNPKTRAHRPTSLQEVVALQAHVFQTAMQPKTNPKVLCMLSRAFVELERLRRDMRGLPNPRPVSVEGLVRTKRAHAFTLPKEIAPQKMAAQPEASTDCAAEKKDGAPGEDHRAKEPAAEHPEAGEE
jgi:hypothetical protein